MSLYLGHLRIAEALLLGVVATGRNRPTRARRRGEAGMETLQIVILAAILSVAAIGAGVYLKSKIEGTAANVQTP